MPHKLSADLKLVSCSCEEKSPLEEVHRILGSSDWDNKLGVRGLPLSPNQQQHLETLSTCGLLSVHRQTIRDRRWAKGSSSLLNPYSWANSTLDTHGLCWQCWTRHLGGCLDGQIFSQLCGHCQGGTAGRTQCSAQPLENLSPWREGKIAEREENWSP